MARVHAARRRDHRSGRPPPGDGRDGRAARRAHARRRVRRARRAGRRCPAPTRSTPSSAPGAGLYLVVLLATLLLGMAEVLRDNSAQTLMPSLVRRRPARDGERTDVERRGRSPTHSSVPRSARCCCAAAFAVPFFVDAGSFFAAAALVALIPGTFRADGRRRRARDAIACKAELTEGVRWLMAPSAAAADGDHPRPDERRQR